MNTSNKLIFVLSLALLPSLGFARGDRGDRGPNPKRVEKVLKQLNLTEDQSTKIEAIHTDAKDAKKAQREQAKAARDAFQNALADSGASNDKLTELHKALIASKTQEMESRFNMMLEVRSILTADQRAEFQKLMKENKSKKGKKGKKGKMRRNKKDSQ